MLTLKKIGKAKRELKKESASSKGLQKSADLPSPRPPSAPSQRSTSSLAETKPNSIDQDNINGPPDTQTSHSTCLVQFRIIAGSYEHNLQCLRVSIPADRTKEAIFNPIFHFQAHTLSIKSIDVARRYLVTGSNDEHIRIYDLQKRKELGNLMSDQGTVTTLKFSREGNLLNRGSRETSKSGKWLLLGSEDGKIFIWRTKDWEKLGTLRGHLDRVNDVDIHPSGRVAISVSRDNTIRLWNLMTAKKAAVLKIKGKHHLGQSADYVRWNLDGNHFVVGMINQLLVYNTLQAKIIRIIALLSPLVAFDMFELYGEAVLATGHENGSIAIYSFAKSILPLDLQSIDDCLKRPADTVEPMFVLQGHASRVKDLAFFRDTKETHNIPFLVSISSDGKIVVWNLSASVRDQVAVYETGERLNCVVASSDSIEKPSTMKRRFTSIEEMEIADATTAPAESEYETDGEEICKHMNPQSKHRGKRRNKGKVSVKIE